MDLKLQRLSKLYSAVVCDALDACGLRDQALAPGLHAIGTPQTLVGRAATLAVVAVDAVPDPPYVTQFQAVDALGPGEVMVVSAPDVASAFWGELITTRAMVKGAAGAIVDGYCRDVQRVRSHDFGVWARGVHPADSAGRLDAVSWGAPVQCAGVRVESGDYVLADVDGVVVVPAAVVDEVLQAAEEKAGIEDQVRAQLSAGETIVDTFDRFGVM